MNSKFIGGLLLIVGTTIGGGMLALPLVTSPAGFVNSLLLLFGCWIVMTLCALLILEVNFWLPVNSNIITMAKITLGRAGQCIAWLSYLFLIYALLAAYMAGGGDLLHTLFVKIGLNAPVSVTALVFTVILGIVVALGVHCVDYLNRGLMLSKFIFYVLLVACILPFLTSDKLLEGEIHYLVNGASVVMAAFGFAIIVPSLRHYFDNDIKKMRQAIIIGSLIPLFFYILWDLAIMGVIPRTGEDGLLTMLNSGQSNSQFVNSISRILNRDAITYLARLFTSICLATSFLGCALSLSDFIADGLNIKKKGKDNWLIYSLTFLPPLGLVWFYPGSFIVALNYAGFFCAMLLIILPVLMAWQGRYRKGLATGYRLMGGKPVLGLLLVAGILIMAQGIVENLSG